MTTYGGITCQTLKRGYTAQVVYYYESVYIAKTLQPSRGTSPNVHPLSV